MTTEAVIIECGFMIIGVTGEAIFFKPKECFFSLFYFFISYMSRLMAIAAFER